MTPAWESLLRDYRAENVFNPWGECDHAIDGVVDAAHWRYQRLMQHFMCEPEYLLIGEAPGYQGCRWTGVPFTSERLMCTHQIPFVKPPNLDHDWRLTSRATSWAEPSATIVWRALRTLGIHEQTVCWNAFPWHPHKPGNPYSNRTPAHGEIYGTDDADISAPLTLLEGLIDRFPSATLVTVGNVAYEAANTVVGARRVHRVRHPANGGATLFREQLGALINV